MKYLLLLSLRSIRANKWRSLVNVAVIAISVAMVVVTSGLCAVLIELQRQTVLMDLPAGTSSIEIDRVLAEDWGMNALRTFSAFLNVALLMIAAFSIYGSFASGIRERAKMMAVLRSVGASDFQKSFVTVAEALLLALLGIPLGLFIGLPIVYETAKHIENIVSPALPEVEAIFQLDIQTIFTLLLFSVLAVFLATLISILKTQKSSIITLAKSTAGIEISLKKSILDHIMWRLFGKAGEIASANYINQKRNYRFLSFTFGTAMLLYVGGSLIIPYFKQIGPPDPNYQSEAYALLDTLQTAILTVPFLALLNTVFVFFNNYQMRKGEFAVFQSIGMDTKMMYKIVVLEWIYRGFYLFFYGFVGSYLFNLFLYGVLNVSEIANEWIDPTMQLLHAFLIVVALVLVMTVAVITKLRRMNIVEALKELN